jgi:hypothetical protein
MTAIPQLVIAQVPAIRWFVAQHRIYEDGRDITRVAVQLENLELADISAIRFIEPGSSRPNPHVTKKKARESCERTAYSGYSTYWHWQRAIDAAENDSWRYEYYLGWDLDGHTLTEGGIYEIQIDYESDSDTITLSRTFFFSEYYPLPTVSLMPERNRKLNVEELADGGMILRWNAPAVAHEDTSARVFIYLEDDPGDGECYIHAAFWSPTHMGMLIMPSEAVQALTDSDYYNGYFSFMYQIRVNDNSERSYGNFERYNYP